MLENVSVFEEAVGHKPLFTRDVLKQAASDLAKTHDPKTRNDKIVAPNVLGGGSSDVWNSGRTSQIGWRSSYRLQAALGKLSFYSISSWSSSVSLADKYDLRPNDDATDPFRLRIAKMPRPVDELNAIAGPQQRFIRRSVWYEMTKLLRTLSVKVDNIVCIALGALHQDDFENGLSPNSCGQNLVACCIAEYLESLYNDSKSIPIIACDPEYSVADIKLLSSLSHPISVVSDPQHYLSITPNSLVMCISIPAFVPVWEIVADSLFPSGPTAMLCNELFSHPWHEYGQIGPFEQKPPRVAKMLELYHEPLWLGGEVGGDQDIDSVIRWFRFPVWYARKQ